MAVRVKIGAKRVAVAVSGQWRIQRSPWWPRTGTAAGLIVFLLLSGCVVKKELPSKLPEAGSATVSPGVARQFDVGNLILKNPLPEDVADGYLEFAKAPQMGFGVTLVDGRLSARSHEHWIYCFYIHSGNARISIGEKSFTTGTGDMIYIPRGAIYTAVALNNQPLQLITVYSPPLDKNDIEYLERAESEREGVSGKPAESTP